MPSGMARQCKSSYTAISGIGKSALVDHFLSGIRKCGEAVVLAGRCNEHVVAPYEALHSIVDALTRYLRKPGIGLLARGASAARHPAAAVPLPRPGSSGGRGQGTAGTGRGDRSAGASPASLRRVS